MPSRPDRHALAFAALLAAAVAPASAQMWAGIGPRGVAMPASGGVASAAPAPQPPIAALRAVPSPEGLPAATGGLPTAFPLRHLPTPAEGWQVVGETGELRWPIFLTARDAAEATTMRVAYTSAIAVLPETSVLTLRVNGRIVGIDPIDAAQGLRRIAFTIPAGIVEPGFNEVALTIEQRHRVDCSIAASYELWTRFDPAETGLEMRAGGSTVATVADLPAVSPRPDGSVPMHVLLSGKTNPSHLGKLIGATQTVALRGRMGQPIVDFESADGDPSGIDLAVGSREALAKVPRLHGRLEGSGPGVLVLAAGGAGERPLIVFTGTTDADVEAAVGSLAAAAPTGTVSGLLAAATIPGRPLGGGESVALHDLGLLPRDFAGRSYKRSATFTLPADMLPADYARGTFDLSGSYAAGLEHGAKIRIDVNGKNSGIVALPSAKGGTFDHDQLFLPLGLMRPGVNRLDVYAELPRPDDRTCAAATGTRFHLSDRSQLTLPVLARVQRLPDLALATAGGLPYADGRARLVVPKPDRDSVGAALTLTARVAVATGRPVPFAFTTSLATRGEGSTLIVAPARSLDPAIMDRVGLEPGALETLWRGEAEGRSVDKAVGVAAGPRWWLDDPNAIAACKPSLASASDDVRAPAGDLVEGRGAVRRSPWTERSRRWMAAARGALNLNPPVPTAALVGARTTLVLAQGVDDAAGDVTTIVTAPNPALLRAGVTCLADPRVWGAVHGRLASIEGATGRVAASDAMRFTYRGGSTASLRNDRLVLAGWLSLNPLAFVAAALLLALALSGSTLLFVRGIGRRSE